jgi:hypothetical protein
MNLAERQTKGPKFVTLLARIVCLSLLLVSSVYSGQNLRPPTNYQDYGACPFECCTYRRWSVVADTVVYTQRSASSGVAFRVKKGDHVIGLTGVVITLRPGKAIVKKAATLGIGKRRTQVKPGDILYLLHYEGEGVYKIWFQGSIYEHEMPTAPDSVSKVATEKRQESIQVLSEPDYVWWVKVKSSRGQIGWSKQDKNFGDMDACG